MKLSQPLFALVTLVFTAGCATAPASPILRRSDRGSKGVDPVAYATDLRECRPTRLRSLRGRRSP